MMRELGMCALLGLVLSASGSLTGCEEGPLEQAGERADDAAEDAAEAVEEATEDAADAVDDAADDAEDAVDDRM